MAEQCTVLIAASDLLPALTQRTRETNTELLTFSDTDALRALDVITKRRPRVVALERLFAATPRGTALISRIKADPTLTNSEIRVVSHDSDWVRVPLPKPAGAPGGTAADTVPATVVARPEPVLDQRGTRRAPRFKMTGSVDLLVDGNQVTLVDLSIVGAQVVAASALKPNQRVRIALSDAAASIRFNAAVAWARFEIPTGAGPRYRAGLEFVDADTSAVDVFCARHKA